MLWKIDGYLVIPHELLHVFAYRLIGKKCHYQLGEHFVEPLERRTFRERLFVLLFPLFITGGLGALFMLLWIATYLLAQYPLLPPAYFQAAPLWHKSLWFLWVGLILYSGSSIMDIVTAIHLLFQKLSQQPPNNTSK